MADYAMLVRSPRIIRVGRLVVGKGQVPPNALKWRLRRSVIGIDDWTIIKLALMVSSG
jgi:hypothetical protein